MESPAQRVAGPELNGTMIGSFFAIGRVTLFLISVREDRLRSSVCIARTADSAGKPFGLKYRRILDGRKALDCQRGTAVPRKKSDRSIHGRDVPPESVLLARCRCGSRGAPRALRA